jgi:hypothetical protein
MGRTGVSVETASAAQFSKSAVGTEEGADSRFWSVSFGLVAFACLATATLLPTQSRAQDWEFVITPYLWGAGQSGTAGVIEGLPPSEFDLSFGDIFDNLNGAFMVVGSARKGNVGISMDFQYVEVEAEGDTPGTNFDTATLISRTKIFTTTFDYKFAETPEWEVWASGGARYWYVENKIKLRGGPSPNFTVDGHDDWWDVMIGARGLYRFGDKSSVNVWGYAGGFGLTSDLMTDIYVGYNYSFTPMIAASAGWRYLSVDYENDDFVYDIVQQGPMLGVTFTF